MLAAREFQRVKNKAIVDIIKSRVDGRYEHASCLTKAMDLGRGNDGIDAGCMPEYEGVREIMMLVSSWLQCLEAKLESSHVSIACCCFWRVGFFVLA